MASATGALGTLLPKLAQLLHDEYKLQKGVRKNIDFLRKELEHTHAALRAVGEVPLEELSEQVKLWARDAREISYDMEDVVDTFLVRVECPDPLNRRSSRKFIQKMKSFLTVYKRHQVGEQIKDIKERVKDIAERRKRYKVDTITHGATTVDPRIAHLYTKATDLVGINESREELVTMLDQQMIVSIVGFGGLGKTTLAKAVYDKIKSQFDCTAFVIVSQNPNMKKFLIDLLHEVGQGAVDHNKSLDEKQLIDTARRFLHDKRYFIDDIWNTSDWDMVIKHALPDDNTGCRIVTTTRNIKVAKHIGHTYKMQPLSLDTSRTLFYKRIFGIEDPEKCFLDEELAEVSNKIINKCSGVPLAIITIASLLAGKGRNKVVWDEVCNSIGNGMENNLDAKNMRKILSYSYYDLPSYLRTCLLYLSLFPEDFYIGKGHLIWLWVAEGFIYPDKQWKKTLFEVGETYFNELINRSMIQPVYPACGTNISHCHVHDMVLDLIISISSEENFITILSNTDQTSASTIVRRLSLQQGKRTCAMNQAKQSMQLARSVVAIPSAHGQILTFRSFKVLRVLDLQYCDLSEQCYTLQHLGCLFHLRYLSLNTTGIDQLPESVGNLRHLEILDVRYNKIAQLPKCVARLTHLLRLVVHQDTRISNGIGSLTFIEELNCLSIDDESVVQSLGLLIELRVLHIILRTDRCTDNLVVSLCKLRKIQELVMYVDVDDHQRFMGILDAWIAPQQLRELYVLKAFFFSTLPAWLKNITLYQDLASLFIGVRELRQEDLEILGRLPALCFLGLSVGHKDLGILRRRFFTINAGWFPCLALCKLWGFQWPVRFQQGAVPGLRYLEFDFHVPEATDTAGKDDGFELGLENLLSLVLVGVKLVRGGASVVLVEEAKDALRRAAERHPNNNLRLRIY